MSWSSGQRVWVSFAFRTEGVGVVRLYGRGCGCRSPSRQSVWVVWPSSLNWALTNQIYVYLDKLTVALPLADENTQEIKKGTLFNNGLDETMCKFSANLSSDKATNSQTIIKHEMWEILTVTVAL